MNVRIERHEEGDWERISIDGHGIYEGHGMDLAEFLRLVGPSVDIDVEVCDGISDEAWGW